LGHFEDKPKASWKEVVINKYQLSLMNPCDMLHHGKRAAKVDAHCDKLVAPCGLRGRK